jgi:hypothetical protein
MISESLYNKLLELESELSSQLEAVRKLIAAKDYDVKSFAEKQGIRFDGGMVSKGDRSWEDYILIVLEILGGAARSSGIYDYMIEANKNLSEDWIKNVVRKKLILLVNQGKVEAQSGGNKKLGKVYIAIASNYSLDEKDVKSASKKKSIEIEKILLKKRNEYKE